MTETRKPPTSPLMRTAFFVRAFLALGLLSPFILLPDWAFLTQARWYDFSYGSGSVMILFLVLFPPGWFAMMLVYFVNPDRLANWQDVALVVGGFLLLWFLLLVWVPGIIVMARFAYDSGLGRWLGSSFGWMVMSIIISGQIFAWVTAYYVLRSLPPPLGHRVEAY